MANLSRSRLIHKADLEAAAFWLALAARHTKPPPERDQAMGQRAPDGRLGGLVANWQVAATALLRWHPGVLRNAAERGFVASAAPPLSAAEHERLCAIAARANLSWTR